MLATTFALSLALATSQLVAAQVNSGLLGQEAIEAHFTQAALVPSFLPTFAPVALMNVTFADGTISPGEPLTQDQVSVVPTVSITPVNNTVQLGGNYTLLMADAGPVGTDETQGQTRHWLVNGATLNGTSTVPLPVVTNKGLDVTKYAGPAPAAGSGAHRYVILLYTQPENFTAPAGLDSADVGVATFNLLDYVQTSGLGAIVAGTYFTVEVGTASATPSSTSAVVTSTLPAAQSSSAIAPPPSAQTSQAPAGNQPNAAGITIASLPKALFAGILGAGFFLL